MRGPPLGPSGEDITWPDQVAPRGRKTSSTRKIKPQTSNLVMRNHPSMVFLYPKLPSFDRKLPRIDPNPKVARSSYHLT